MRLGFDPFFRKVFYLAFVSFVLFAGGGGFGLDGGFGGFALKIVDLG